MARKNDDPRLAPLIQAQSQLDAARTTYEEKVKHAQDALKRAKKAHAGMVGMAKDRLDAENKRWSTPVGTFEDAKLYYDRLVNNGQTLRLEPGISTGVSTTNSNVTLTAKTSQSSLELHCEEKRLDKARDFADQIRQIAEESKKNTSAHERNVAVLANSLAEAKADTSQIEQAQKDLDYASAQQGPIQAASLKVSQVREHINPELLRKYDGQRRSPEQSRGLVIFVVIVVLIVVSLIFGILLR